jgi:hypothetical protein
MFFFYFFGILGITEVHFERQTFKFFAKTALKITTTSLYLIGSEVCAKVKRKKATHLRRFASVSLLMMQHW